jgi:long-chain acyl-CoA synthetase
MITWLDRHSPESIALIESPTDRSISYGDLAQQVRIVSSFLGQISDRCLVFLHAANTADAIVSYLACLDANFPVCLIDPNGTSEANDRLTSVYQPGIILAADPSNLRSGYTSIGNLPDSSYQAYRSIEPNSIPTLHPDLSLLLPTSGSTGNPKLVRLTQANLRANAAAIAKYLNLSPAEIAIESLPIHYSYGLSIVNSHLHAGGTIVLTPHSFMRPEFWEDVTNYRCTSFAGVPYMYETLHRLKFDLSKYPQLKTITQAGGGLRADIKESFATQAIAHDRQFFVMYGQTEATARIAYVPPARLIDKLGSIGMAIPDGELTLSPVAESEGLFELVYRGANVMMGYAESAASLALGDELNGVLKTGDLARVDEEGFFFINGRLKRFAKLFGKRVSLDDIETDVEVTFNCRAAAIESAKGISIFVVSTNEFDLKSIKLHIASKLSVTPTAIAVSELEALPMTSSGKKDYKALSS